MIPRCIDLIDVIHLMHGKIGYRLLPIYNQLRNIILGTKNTFYVIRSTGDALRVVVN